jgi:hypothetical protein
VRAIAKEDPLLTTAVQSAALAHCTLGMSSAPVSAPAGDHTLPPSDVVYVTSLAPFVPTAIHAWTVGHEMPLSCGMAGPGTGCGVHFIPASLVATMTVAGDAADELGPATPTAQHRSAFAHDTAPS